MTRLEYIGKTLRLPDCTRCGTSLPLDEAQDEVARLMLREWHPGVSVDHGIYHRHCRPTEVTSG